MNKQVRDTTKESAEAEQAAAKFDAKAQFGVPNLQAWLRTAYYHGYRDALLKQRPDNGSPAP